MTTGIHHITAIASDAVKTFEFYSDSLGLRLVKKTVNQDDVSTYHLFFGDKDGRPGMDVTFFVFLPAMQGVAGNGQVTTISFSVPESSLPFWLKRFEKRGIKHSPIKTVSGLKGIDFVDPDGLQLELVGESSSMPEELSIWTTPDIKKSHAIRNFYSATLTVPSLAMIDPILKQVFGYEQVARETNKSTYSLKHSGRAHVLEVIEDVAIQYGLNAAGTVHHIAFRAADETHQLQLRQKVIALGLQPTPVIDRFYFKSVYFRTPAGILFEIATDGPGFTADEPADKLGSKLALPPFLEPRRKQIEANVPELKLPGS